MLTKLKSILPALLALYFSATMYAGDRINFMGMNWDESCAWEENGLWFTIDPDKANQGCAVLLPKNQTASQTQEVSIPRRSNKGIKVIAILGSAFRNNTAVTSVQIPETVQGIESGAFAGAINLSNVEIDIHSQYYTSISGVVFNKDKTELILWPAALTGVNATDIRNNYNMGSIADWSCAYVKEIPRDAFRNNNVTYIGEYAFFNSRITYMPTTRTEFIGNHAFDGCKDLTSLSLSGMIRSIGDYALARSGVESGSIGIYDYTGYIGKGIYAECKQLKRFSANINSEEPPIRILSDSCCYGCDMLESVTCNMPTVGSSAFEGCSALKSVTLYGLVTSILSKAFSGCAAMSNIYSYNPVPPSFVETTFANVPKSCLLTVNSKDIDTYTASPWNDVFTMLPQTITIGNFTYSLDAKTFFASCNRYDGTESEITVPATINVCGIDFTVVYAIGSVALNSRSTLRKVNLPSTVTQIGGFSGCTELTKINFPDNLVLIENNAFGGCVKLGNPTIPTTVQSIGTNPYQGCTAITSINVAEGNKVYVSHDGDLYSIDGTQLIATPSSRSSVTVREGTVKILANACAGSPNLKTISIPATVTFLLTSAFLDCPVLENISVAKENEKFLFRNGGLYENRGGGMLALRVAPPSQKAITVDDKTDYISGDAFMASSVLESIEIPASVNTIISTAFKDCKALKSVTCHGSTPPYCNNNNASVDVSGVTLYVPAGTSNEYRKDAEMLWCMFKSIIELEPSAIDEVNVEESNAPVEYYNMHGVHVVNPSSGIYIRRQGNNVTKILIP